MTGMSWRRLPLKRVAEIMPSNVDKHSVEGELPVRLCNYVDVYNNDRIEDTLDFMPATASEAQIARFTLKAQDVLVTKDSEEPSDIGIPAFVPRDMPGVVCGYHLAILRPNTERVYGSFLRWALQSADVQAYHETAATGISRYALGINDLGMTPLHLPDRAKQTRIANFLDEQTARIDALIAEKERLDGLLGEYRQAVIAQAVTKGLDPGTPMKDSGIAWLGAVPEHWERWKLSHAFGRIGSGTTPPTDQQEWYEDGNIPWITTGELRENRIEQTAKYVTTAALGKFSALQVFPPESLAIAMYGATIGRLGILGTDATTNQACCVLSSPDHLVVPFVFFWLRAFRQALISLFATGGGQPNISQDSVASLRVPAPSLKEQAAIANFLDEQTARVDALREHCKGHIKLLREYRSSLISAAVTGQLDVDGFKSGLS